MLDVVAKTTLNHHLVNLGGALQRKVYRRYASLDLDCVAMVAHIGGNQLIVTLHLMQLVRAIKFGAHAHIRAQPIDRSTDEWLAI